MRSFTVSSPTLSGSHIGVPHPATRATITAGEWALVMGAHVDQGMEVETTKQVDSLLREVSVQLGPIGPELYHLTSDPWCTQNVLAEHKAIARQLQASFVAFLTNAGVREDHLSCFAAVPRRKCRIEEVAESWYDGDLSGACLCLGWGEHRL